MEIRKRSSKVLARRHDLNYFKKGSPLRRRQWKLTLGALAVAGIWLAVTWYTSSSQLLSKGPISSSHAVFGEKCESCHVPLEGSLVQRAGFRRHVEDSACQSCHGVPPHYEVLSSVRAFSYSLSERRDSALDHHANPLVTPKCGSCHVEHVGSMTLAHTADSNCTQCHAHLSTRDGNLTIASGIRSFTDGHPEFAPLRAGYVPAGNLKFNHAAHLREDGVLTAHGRVSLTCADCHRTAPMLNASPWRFGSAALQPTSGAAADAPVQRAHPLDQRAQMAATTYASSCHDCHALQFDRDATAEAPHKDPATVRAFIATQLRAFAAQHPEVVAAELRNWKPDFVAQVPRQPALPVPHNAAEWIVVRRAQAERRIWHQSCGLCHQMQLTPESTSTPTIADLSAHLEDAAALPVIAPTQAPAQYLTRAVFSHQSHAAVACEQCHSRALGSYSAQDVLLPSIATCRQCHDGVSRPQGPAPASGHAESGCFLCHQYHDWQHARPGLIRGHDLKLNQISLADSPRPWLGQ